MTYRVQSLGYLVSARVDATHQPNVSFLRHLRQQALGIPAHLFPLPCRGKPNPHANRTKFTELDEGVVKVHPLRIQFFPNDLPGIDGAIGERGGGGEVDVQSKSFKRITLVPEKSYAFT